MTRTDDALEIVTSNVPVVKCTTSVDWSFHSSSAALGSILAASGLQTKDYNVLHTRRLIKELNGENLMIRMKWNELTSNINELINLSVNEHSFTMSI